MIDFKLNKTDDVSFSRTKSSKKLHIQFTTAGYPVFHVRFTTDKEQAPMATDHAFHIQFYTAEKEDETYSLDTIIDNEELAQNIKIALQTELGELPDTSFGSELYSYKHKDITSKDNLSAIRQIAEQTATDIVGLPVTARVVSENNDAAGYFYGQNITIYLSTTAGIEICRFTL